MEKNPALGNRALLRRSRAGGIVAEPWSTGNNESIYPGADAFLIRQGTGGGVLGSGVVTSKVEEREHYSKPNKTALYVDINWYVLVDPSEVLPLDVVAKHFPKNKWKGIQASGTSVPPHYVVDLWKLWSMHLDKIGRDSSEAWRRAIEPLAEEVPPGTFIEGTPLQITVNAYERNSQARQACLGHHGYKCLICSFDFEATYGEIGRQYIHVHHLKELAKIGRAYRVNPVKDLRPICPNCHAMVHRPGMTWAKLKRIISGR